MRRALAPMQKNPNAIDAIHKLADIERAFEACEDFLKEIRR
jgi:hypothetical protein